MLRSQCLVGVASSISTVAVTGAGVVDREATDSVAALERRTRTKIGLTILRPNGSLVIAHRPHERFPLASTQKLPLVMTVLAKSRLSTTRFVEVKKSDLLPDYSDISQRYPNGGKLRLDDICAGTVSQSDNTGAQVLARLVGGPQAVTAYLQSIGITDVRVDRTERHLPERAEKLDPRDTGTPAAMARLVWRLAYDSPLPPTPTQKLLSWMRATTTGDKRIRAGVPKSWRVADKTGSYENAANDIGLIYPPQRSPLAIACYVYGVTTTDDGSHIIAAVIRTIRSLI